jgi:hypothetical protein
MASACPDAFVVTDENKKVPTIITARRIEKLAFMENPPYMVLDIPMPSSALAHGIV